MELKGVCVSTIRPSGAAGWPLKGRGIVYRARMMTRTLRFMTVHGWRWEEEPESDACHQRGKYCAQLLELDRFAIAGNALGAVIGRWGIALMVALQVKDCIRANFLRLIASLENGVPLRGGAAKR